MASFTDSLRRVAGNRHREHPDPRGGRIVAAIECILNQNARDGGAASFSALNERVLRTCTGHRVGIVQIPCPEQRCLGPARTRPAGSSIREALAAPDASRRCAALAAEVADRLVDCQRGGCSVMAVLGGNVASPGCAVHADADGLAPESGAFMLELQRALRQRGMEIPFRGIRDADPAREADDIAWLDGHLRMPEVLPRS